MDKTTKSGGRGKHQGNTKSTPSDRGRNNSTKSSSGYGKKKEVRRKEGDEGFWITDPEDGTRCYVTGSRGIDREVIRVPKGTGKTALAVHQSATMAAPAPAGVPNSMIRYWRRNGRCLGCGSEQHKVAQCDAKPSTSSGGTGSARADQKKASHGGSSTGGTRKEHVPSKSNPERTGAKEKGPQPQPAGPKGQKRKHEGNTSATGFTPPSKKQVSKKFEYAKAAENAFELAIVSEDKAHISRKDFNNLRDAADKLFLEQLEKGETDLINVETWSYSNSLATVNVTDEKSREALQGEAKKMKLQVVDARQLRAERRPVKILSGLLTGPASKHSREVLEKLIKFEVDRQKIAGRLEIASSVTVPRSGNLVLRILVDDVAEARMKELRYELRIGASGKVRFEDPKTKHSVDSNARKMRYDKVVKEIEAGKKKIEALCKQRAQLDEEMDLAEALPVLNEGTTTSTPLAATKRDECEDYVDSD